VRIKERCSRITIFDSGRNWNLPRAKRNIWNRHSFNAVFCSSQIDSDARKHSNFK